MTGGFLRLDFGLLMRRSPNPLIEHDVVFIDHQVLVIARQTEIWPTFWSVFAVCCDSSLYIFYKGSHFNHPWLS